MNNFQYITNSDINKKKWDTCISESFNSRVYGLSWYLDIVCENWDGIVFGDYEMVFPVIFKKRFFLKKSYHPFFCQQLGPFYKNKNFANIDNSLNFHSFFLKYFNKYTYCSTSEYSLQIDIEIIKKITLYFKTLKSGMKNVYEFYCDEMANLELDLDQAYDQIQDSYSTNTIRNLKKSKGYNLQIQKDISVSVFMELYKTNKKIKNSIQKSFSFTDNYSIIKDLISTCLNKKKGQLIGVFDQKKNMISAAFFLSSFNRYIMLFNVTRPDFKKYHGMTFLIDDFIKSNSNQYKLLDFEGSNLEGVRKFYSGFGSCYSPYFSITCSNSYWNINSHVT